MDYRKEAIYQLMDTVGDGSGTTNAIGNYSDIGAGLTEFRLKHNTGVQELRRLLVYIEDSGSLDAALYGNGQILTNGIRIQLRNSSAQVLEEYTAFPILSNGDWAGHCHDAVPLSWGTGNQILSIRWTFSKSGQPIYVNGFQGEYLTILLNDDFSGLVKHLFIVQGKYKDLNETS